MNNKRTFKLSEFVAQGSNVTCLTIGHKYNRLVATGGEDAKVNLWTMDKPTCMMSLPGNSSAIQNLAFSSNEDRIVSGTQSGAIKVFDLEDNKVICNLSGHKSGISSLEFHSYADYIASGSVDSHIRLWDLRRKGCIFTYKGHTNGINSLKFSPDSKWIASASDDTCVKIWDLKAGKLLTDLKGHSGPVNKLEFHPNEFLLATGSSDKTIKFWDLEKMELVSTSPINTGAIKTILFEPSGKCLFAGSHDYLHSYSWEPAICHDSVYCQWKQIYDIVCVQNRLIAASFNQNLVSFYAVDLTQVAPIGTPPVQQSTHLNDNAIAARLYQSPLSNTTRRNFSTHDVNRPPELSEESITQQQQHQQTDSHSDDMSEASIHNLDEYNKIFKPRKELDRPRIVAAAQMQQQQQQSHPINTSKMKPSFSSPEPIKSIDIQPSLVLKLQNEQQQQQHSNSPVYKSQQNLQQPSTSLPTHDNPSSLPQHQQQKQVNQSIQDYQVKFYETPQSKVELPNKKEPSLPDYKDFIPKQQNMDKLEIMDLVSQIDTGHEPMMKAIRSRLRNIFNLRTMWTNGNIKAALDTAVNTDDPGVMADILNQINQTANLWTLDICTILLPAIKNLIDSKYEEHIQVGCDSAKVVFKNFGKLIRSNLIPLSGNACGVDLSREERQRKCRSCYNYLTNIITIIDKKQTQITSNKLLNNFREINLLMKTIE